VFGGVGRSVNLCRCTCGRERLSARARSTGGWASERIEDLLDWRTASFETAASQLPQDEEVFDDIKEIPHPEEAARRPSRRTHGRGCSLHFDFLTGPGAGRQAAARGVLSSLGRFHADFWANELA